MDLPDTVYLKEILALDRKQIPTLYLKIIVAFEEHVLSLDS